MKVLQFIPNLQRGGAERFVIDICNEFVKNNVEVILVILYASTDPFQSLIKELDPKIKIVFLNKKSGLDFSLFKKIKNTIKEEKPSVIHTHLRTFNYLQFFSIFFKNILFAHTLHTTPSAEFGRTGRILAKLFFRMSNVIPITISELANEEFKHVFPKIYNINIANGRSFPVKTNQYQEAALELENYRKEYPNHLIILHIANITPPKNQKLLLQVFSKLENKKVILLAIGSARVFPELFSSLQEIKPKNVFFLGEKVNATDYLYDSDAFCLSSIYEGAPISLLEAMAIGVTPICTPVGSMQHIIKNGINGFLASEISEKALLECILQRIKLTQKELTKMTSSVKDDYLKNYSIEKCASNYLDAWNHSA